MTVTNAYRDTCCARNVKVCSRLASVTITGHSARSRTRMGKGPGAHGHGREGSKAGHLAPPHRPVGAIYPTPTVQTGLGEG